MQLNKEILENVRCQWRKADVEFRQCRDKFTSLERDATNEIKEKTKDFPVKYIASFTAGILTDRWQPCIGATINLNKDHLYTLVYNKKTGFMWNRHDCGTIYKSTSKNIDPGDIRFDLQRLLQIFSDFEKDTGIPVELRETPIPDITRSPQRTEDVLEIHYNDDPKIVHEDIVSYLGWDCNDKWVVVSTNKHDILYWGSSAHGAGMTHKVVISPENQCELDKFVRFTNESDNDAEIPQSVIDLFTKNGCSIT